MINCLQKKFSSLKEPKYHFKEITTEELESARLVSQKIVHRTVSGSAKFQAVVINPNSNIIKASPRLCACEKCLDGYGSCHLFTDYELVSHQLNQVSLRSNFETYDTANQNEKQGNNVNKILHIDSVVAVAADDNSPDTFWFVIIEGEEDQRDTPTKDQYGNQVPAGQPFLTGRYLERGRHPNIYCRSKRTLYFYKESIVYPFVQAQETKKGFLVSDIEFCEILKYVESNNLSSFF